MRRSTPPVWHVDLYRIEDPSELDELGLDDIRGDGVLLVEWPERAGAARGPMRSRLSLDFARGRRTRLDSRGAPGMGRAMAAPMIPPAACARIPRPLTAGPGREILPLAGDAVFRRYFRVIATASAARC